MLSTTAIFQAGSTQLLGVEACAFGAADGARKWCTPRYALEGGIAPVSVAALADNGQQLVLHMAAVGLLLVDAGTSGDAAASPPAISMLYNTSANCCSATAVTLASGVAVLSIPDGSRSGIWCQCQHSKLVGVQLP